MDNAIQFPVTAESDLNGFEWLQVESMRLMEENADTEHAICGNEWLVIEHLRAAEEAGAEIELLQALRGCACANVAQLARTLAEAA